MAKVSVITAVYCDIVEKTNWLIEAIDSVRSQTMTDWEMILIDDKSPIEPTEAEFRYADDPRIRWLNNAYNFGPAATRNTAVTAAVSECIIALDSDDMLAGPDVLETMYNVWLNDPTKIIYGNLQMLAPNEQGVYQRQPKVFDFGEYTFELATNLNGFIPVTAMHSKVCHFMAEGWKPELAEGLEDVEKWIMAGKRGYCGQRVDIVSFLYRKQERSRSYEMLHVNKQFEVMQQKIKSMHSDVYNGRFPMACCGKGAPATPAIDPVVMSQQATRGQIVPLSGYEEKDLEWVKYAGPKTGRHDILGRGPAHLPPSYTIFGTGQIFQIHKLHHKQFEGLQRLGFEMNQPDPREREPEPEPVQIVERPPEITEIRPPKLSTILRLDSVAAKVAVPDIQPMPAGFEEPIETESIPAAPPPPPSPAAPTIDTFAMVERDYLETEKQAQVKPPVTPTIEPRVDFAQAERDYLQRQKQAEAKALSDAESKFQLSELGLTARLRETLAGDTVQLWNVEKLARAEPQTLSAYPGIGIKTANVIIEKALALVNRGF